MLIVFYSGKRKDLIRDLLAPVFLLVAEQPPKVIALVSFVPFPDMLGHFLVSLTHEPVMLLLPFVKIVPIEIPIEIPIDLLLNVHQHITDTSALV